MSLSKINYVCPVPINLALPSVVYKYRGFNEYLFRSLLMNQIWLAKPASFNDPFEPARIFSGTPFSQALDRNVREAGVLCLCKSNDNLPMWSYYGDGLRGIAVGYDLTLLLGSLSPVNPVKDECSPRWKYLFDLDYRDNGLTEVDEMALLRNDELTDQERQKMFASKAKAYRHEEECRIVVQPSSDSRPEYAWHGHGLYNHAPDAIKEIVFGELISVQDRQAIMKLMAGRKIDYLDAVREKDRFSIAVTHVRAEEKP